MLYLKIKFFRFNRVGLFILSIMIAILAVSTLIPSQVQAADSQYKYINHTVEKGEYLYAIGIKYGSTVEGIKKANHLWSDIIYPGQILKVPVGKFLPQSLYSVKTGDTLFLISQKHRVSLGDLKGINSLKSDAIFPGQILKIPEKQGASFKEILNRKGVDASKAQLDIFIDKSDHTLMIFAGDIWLKSYHAEFGDGGMGDKEIAGDHKTPEGTFYVTEKSVLYPADQYLGSRWMRLSYPNIEDASRGLSWGIINKQTYDSIVTAINNGTTPPQRTALGGGIGIHGGSTPAMGSNWTWGCIGLTNGDVEDFYDFIRVGTKVTIQR